MSSSTVVYNVTVIVTVVLIVVLLRIIVRRVLRALIERGVISPRGLEIIVRLVDLITFLIAIFTIALLFSPQFWVVLVLLGVLALVVYIMLFDVIKPYIAGLAIQMNPVFRSRSLDIILPERNSPISGKLAKINSQYLVIQDVFGNEYYIRNDTVLSSIIRITPVYVRLVVEITYNCPAEDLAKKISTIIQTLETLKVPLFKEEVKVNMLEISNKKVVMGLKLYPVSTPVRQTELLNAIRVIVETVKAFSEESCVLEDVTVKIPMTT